MTADDLRTTVGVLDVTLGFPCGECLVQRDKVEAQHVNDAVALDPLLPVGVSERQLDAAVEADERAVHRAFQ